jgi:hypothetical protein
LYLLIHFIHDNNGPLELWNILENQSVIDSPNLIFAQIVLHKLILRYLLDKLIFYRFLALSNTYSSCLSLLLFDKQWWFYDKASIFNDLLELFFLFMLLKLFREEFYADLCLRNKIFLLDTLL